MYTQGVTKNLINEVVKKNEVNIVASTSKGLFDRLIKWIYRQSQSQLNAAFHPQKHCEDREFVLSGGHLLKHLVGEHCLDKRQQHRILRKEQSEILKNKLFRDDGYIIVPNLLEQAKLDKLKESVEQEVSKEHLLDVKNYKNKKGGGSIFYPSTMETREVVEIANSLAIEVLGFKNSIVKSITGGGVVKHTHFNDDNDALLHVDNLGITTLKWFYFPFGTKKYDKGFGISRKSQTICVEFLNYIYELSLKKVGLKLQGPWDGDDGYRFRQTTDIDYPTYLKKPTYVNSENTLILADTSTFHCRSLSMEGVERITLQGGIANNTTFSHPEMV